MLLQHVSRHSNHNQVNHWTRIDEVTYRLCGPNRYCLLFTNSSQSITVSASHCMLQTAALVFVYCRTRKVSYATIYMVTRLIAAGDTHASSCRKERGKKNPALNVSMFICSETEEQIKQLVPRGVVRFFRPTTFHVFTHHFAEVHFYLCVYAIQSQYVKKKLQNSRSMGLTQSTQTGGLMRYVKIKASICNIHASRSTLLSTTLLAPRLECCWLTVT